MLPIPECLRNTDPEIADVIYAEAARQENHLEMIASENFVSPAVLAAMGSILTNKYAEGYPGHRYYGGCVHVDVAEELARERAKALYGADHANVQPHSGSQANMAVYFALLKPGDIVLGMNLNNGGHLTHGSRVNISGKYFQFDSYGVDPETECIDYDGLRAKALEIRPRLIVAGVSAYPRVIDFERFRAIADEVGAYLMVDMAHIAGLVAAGEHPSPIPFADVVTTTTHKTLRGPRGGMILCRQEHAKAIDKAIFPGTQGGPLMHIVAAKAVCFKEAMSEDFKRYQHQIVLNAKALEEGLRMNGVRMVSGGTDNHLILIDLCDTDITGAQLENWMEESHITVNKNMVPRDQRKPTETSGLRIGTPAVTTRGLVETDMREIADAIGLLIREGEAAIPRVRAMTERLTARYPLY